MQRTKHEAMAQLSGVGVPAGAVLDTQELVDEPSFYERGILQTMTHGERSDDNADLAGSLQRSADRGQIGAAARRAHGGGAADWLELDAAAVAELRRDGIV